MSACWAQTGLKSCQVYRRGANLTCLATASVAPEMLNVWTSARSRRPTAELLQGLRRLGRQHLGLNLYAVRHW